MWVGNYKITLGGKLQKNTLNIKHRTPIHVDLFCLSIEFVKVEHFISTKYK